MRILFPLCLLVVVGAFQTLHSGGTTSCRSAYYCDAAGIRCSKIRLASQAEEHLEELASTWQILEGLVVEYAKSPAKDSARAKELTERFLQTAIEYAQTKEQVEEEHLQKAHYEFEQALREEDSLRQMADEQWALSQLAAAGKNQHDIRIGVTDYVQSRLRMEQERESLAKQVEEVARQSLHELQEKEAKLKTTLKDFRALQREKKERQKAKRNQPIGYSAIAKTSAVDVQRRSDNQRQEYGIRPPPMDPNVSHESGDIKDIRRRDEQSEASPLASRYMQAEQSQSTGHQKLNNQAAFQIESINQNLQETKSAPPRPPSYAVVDWRNRDEGQDVGSGDSKDIKKRQEVQNVQLASDFEEETQHSHHQDIKDIKRRQDVQNVRLASDFEEETQRSHHDMKDIKRRQEDQNVRHASDFEKETQRSHHDAKDIKRRQEVQNIRLVSDVDNEAKRSSRHISQQLNDPSFRMDAFNQQTNEDDMAAAAAARRQRQVANKRSNWRGDYQDETRQLPRAMAKRSNWRTDDRQRVQHFDEARQELNKPVFRVDGINQHAREPGTPPASTPPASRPPPRAWKIMGPDGWTVSSKEDKS